MVLPRQNCTHLTAMDFRVIFAFQAAGGLAPAKVKKDEKRRKDAAAGIFALVNRW